jgi:hypothetical protein
VQGWPRATVDNDDTSPDAGENDDYVFFLVSLTTLCRVLVKIRRSTVLYLGSKVKFSRYRPEQTLGDPVG